ncbi:MAG TPA: aromatic amino acid hydroxylase, partial [Flavobacteriaceae bacterium]|nr:aromatic amino acid hydroxylase [Flavobacteriaceae bacterium]
YEAIRHLSIIKENPNTPEQDILEAEKEIEKITATMGEPSEMAKIRNLHWWTVEYGLIGSLESPKIYGAGLLSSIGESKWCLSDNVTKLPYSIKAANMAFDITKPQPQLYVTPDFAHLSLVLEEFADTMALRNGGLKGIEKLIDSNDLGTIELNTGIQISGNFTRVIDDENYRAIYYQTTGPTALAYKNKQLIGHGKEYHADGFGSPIGKLKGINIAIEDMSPTDLEAYGIYEGKQVTLNFKRGITVTGEIITGKRNLQGKIILISFKNCTVKYGDEILFQPEWGIYDMAVGANITSAYSGIADPDSYKLTYEAPKEKTHKIVYSSKQIAIHKLYQQVRDMRENNTINITELNAIFDKINSSDKEWLLALEIYELVSDLDNSLKTNIFNFLNQNSKGKYGNLINDGLELIN